MKVTGPDGVGDIARQVAFLAVFVSSVSASLASASHGLGEVD